jgi:hypothetical protein
MRRHGPLSFAGRSYAPPSATPPDSRRRRREGRRLSCRPPMPCTLISSWTRVHLGENPSMFFPFSFSMSSLRHDDRYLVPLSHLVQWSNMLPSKTMIGIPKSSIRVTMVCRHRSIAEGACEQTIVIFVEFDLNSAVGEHINSITFLVSAALQLVQQLIRVPLAFPRPARPCYVHGMCMCTFWWLPTMMTDNDGPRHQEKHNHQHLNTVVVATWHLGACWCFYVLTSSPSTVLVRISRMIFLIARVLAMYAYLYTCMRKVIERRSHSCKQAPHLLPVMTSWCHHAYVVIRNSPLTK